ncbi:malto-oligosyltrehalose trehalohydrolase [Mucilaginibacter polytrichastri]|uniref:Malto-oligosyltrehalose trehalohydrolase n=1 Tax=Mucilaginibacter polytrichastri TaxID=1302689 RepID=A0A1Q5ZUW2_9SPHI|nr:malto-oligosyltrehalose trehalohydrolase [Mucilaginibacter polytrichastri]OKS85561.1 Malto-oligosyltrehalose trehalohydrolase [Mucilaginibacter polytrichastri]SFS36607.1 maltooligosyl trehalose hydrolase [Mucilaginibacter polytrichastri]
METVKRTIGVNIDPDGEFNALIWAPNAGRVSLRVCAGRIDLPMQKQDYGYWALKTDQLKDGDLYRIVLDDDKFLPDPSSLSQPKGVHEASQVIDLNAFAWTDEHWKNWHLNEYIIYELHTGTFTPEGTFEAIEGKLDYLKNLGITAIEIMPVAQFAGERNWGYDGVYPFAVQSSYGGPKALQHLVNTCHQKGIAVVLDVVYNHIGPEGNYFSEYGPYFTDKYNTPWGNAINFDDAWCDAVRQYYIENALMWFRDFHIDALRLDAVHAIKDFSPQHILAEIKEHVDHLIKETGRPHHLIIECDLNDTRYINPLDKAGFGMDAQWIDEFHHALRVTAGGERDGYYEDFHGIEHLAKTYNDAYVYDGQYSAHRHKNFGVKATDNPGNQFIVFSQNHDQIGNRMLGERSSQLFSFEMQKLMAAATLIAPFIPMLFMGEEWGEPNPFQYFVSHTDPELAEAVRKGRKAEFAAFHAEGEAPDPMDEQTFIQSKLQWQLKDKGQHQTMFAYYKKLIKLRQYLPVIHNLNRNQVKADADKDKQMLTLQRWYQGDYLVALMNFSNTVQQTTLPHTDKKWIKQLDSADPEWGGPKESPNSFLSEAIIELQPQAVIIYCIG